MQQMGPVVLDFGFAKKVREGWFAVFLHSFALGCAVRSLAVVGYVCIIPLEVLCAFGPHQVEHRAIKTRSFDRLQKMFG